MNRLYCVAVCVLLTVTVGEIVNYKEDSSPDDFAAAFDAQSWRDRRDFYDEVDATMKKLVEGGLRSGYLCDYGWIPQCRGKLDADDCRVKLVACDDYEQRTNLVCKGYNCTELPTTPAPTKPNETSAAQQHTAIGTVLALLVSLFVVAVLL